jgi:glycosyltransferase involved in cell wall biosynthesis
MTAPLDALEIAPPAPVAGQVPAPVPVPAPPPASARSPRIAIFVVAYNAVTTLARVLDRIPPEVREVVEEVYVFDDASQDETYMLGRGFQEVRGWRNLRIFRNEENQGYGGNQKRGYRYAIERGFDIVVLLHGDGQYAPEVLPRILAPLLEGRADAVFGSRMLDPGAARRGGMPLYKWVGNRILTTYQNWMTGARLSEWHSGYRAYRVDALRRLPLEENSDVFHFDCEIILELLDHGFRIVEVPIPVYYGGEICYVNGVRYAKDVFRTVLEHKLHEIGYRSDPRFTVPGRAPPYALKRGPHSSHSQVARLVPSGARVLDVGCEPATVAPLLERGCVVVGVNATRPPGAEALAAFHVRDLERDLDLPGEEGAFDVVLLADVLQRVRGGDALLRAAARRLRPGGRVIVTAGNVAFWFVRLSLLFGRFRYGRRGILDESHVRLFTPATLLEAVRRAGLSVRSVRAAPPPFEAIFPAHAGRGWVRALDALSNALARLWRGPFAYQLVVEAEPLRRAAAPAPAAALGSAAAAPAVATPAAASVPAAPPAPSPAP